MAGVKAELLISEPRPSVIGEVSQSARVQVVSQTYNKTRSVIDMYTASQCDDDRLTLLSEFKNGRLYRYFGTRSGDCPSLVLEQMGHPPVNVIAANGDLTVTVYHNSRTEIRSIITTLRDLSIPTELMSITKCEMFEYGRQRTSLRDLMTERQYEVLQTAYQSGYYRHPKEANISDLSKKLDLHPSTVRQHLSAAEEKLLNYYQSGK